MPDDALSHALGLSKAINEVKGIAHLAIELGIARADEFAKSADRFGLVSGGAVFLVGLARICSSYSRGSLRR